MASSGGSRRSPPPSRPGPGMPLDGRRVVLGVRTPARRRMDAHRRGSGGCPRWRRACGSTARPRKRPASTSRPYPTPASGASRGTRSSSRPLAGDSWRSTEARRAHPRRFVPGRPHRPGGGRSAVGRAFGRRDGRAVRVVEGPLRRRVPADRAGGVPGDAGRPRSRQGRARRASDARDGEARHRRAPGGPRRRSGRRLIRGCSRETPNRGGAAARQDVRAQLEPSRL